MSAMLVEPKVVDASRRRSAIGRLRGLEVLLPTWSELADPATEEGRVACAGSGARNDAFRYWLPDRAPMLRPDDGASKEETRKKLDDACHRLLSNPVIEDYQLEIS